MLRSLTGWQIDPHAALLGTDEIGAAPSTMLRGGRLREPTRSPNFPADRDELLRPLAEREDANALTVMAYIPTAVTAGPATSASPTPSSRCPATSPPAASTASLPQPTRRQDVSQLAYGVLAGVPGGDRLVQVQGAAADQAGAVVDGQRGQGIDRTAARLLGIAS
ncbi:hypothetical protein ACPC39_33305 [Streptomyces cellulosae]